MGDVVHFPLKLVETKEQDLRAKFRASLRLAIEYAGEAFAAGKFDFCVVVVGQESVKDVAQAFLEYEPRFLVKAIAGMKAWDRAAFYRYPSYHVAVMSVGIFRRDKRRLLIGFTEVNRVLLLTDKEIELPGIKDRCNLTKLEIKK